MHLAIDLDGTITKAPEAFKAIGLSLISQGHRVTVLTGALNDFPDSAKTLEGRTNQLKNLNLVKGIDYTDLHIAVGENAHEVALLKAKYCQGENVDLLIDDEPLYCNAVRKVTKVAQFLR